MTEERFEKLRFPVHKLKKEEYCYEAFPKILDIEGFQSIHGPKRTRDRIMKYIFYLYDENTDLTHEISDYTKRKEAAAYEAGFRRNTSAQWSEEVKKLFDLSYPSVVDAVLGYLKFQNNNIWQEINVLEHEKEVFTKERLAPIPEEADGMFFKRRDELMEMTQKRIDALESLYKRFYSDHDDVKEMNYKALPVTPENATKVIDEYVSPNWG
jgi:hypothetical protein